MGDQLRPTPIMLMSTNLLSMDRRLNFRKVRRSPSSPVKSKSLSTGQMTTLLSSTPLTQDLFTVERLSLLKKRAALMVHTVVSVVIITWTKELMSSPPRDVSSPLTGLLHNLTDPNQVNAHLFLLRHRTRSDLRKVAVSSLKSRRLKPDQSLSLR